MIWEHMPKQILCIAKKMDTDQEIPPKYCFVSFYDIPSEKLIVAPCWVPLAMIMGNYPDLYAQFNTKYAEQDYERIMAYQPASVKNAPERVSDKAPKRVSEKAPVKALMKESVKVPERASVKGPVKAPSKAPEKTREELQKQKRDAFKKRLRIANPDEEYNPVSYPLGNVTFNVVNISIIKSSAEVLVNFSLRDNYQDDRLIKRALLLKELDRKVDQRWCLKGKVYETSGGQTEYKRIVHCFVDQKDLRESFARSFRAVMRIDPLPLSVSVSNPIFTGG